MGDITEVIHKISYEVNDDALNNATKTIQLQIAELNRLSVVLDNYSRQLGMLSSAQAKEFDILSRKIDETSKRIDTIAAKSRGVLTEVFSGITKGITGSDGLKDGVAKYVTNIIAEFNNLKKAGEQVSLGFASHMAKMADSGQGSSGKLSTTLNNLGKSLTSATGLVDLAVIALGFLGNEFLKEGGIIDGFINKEKIVVTETDNIIRSFSDMASKVSEIAANEIVDSRILYDTATDLNQAYSNRILAVEELQKRYPQYFGDLSKEAILAGKAADKYKELTGAIIGRAQVEVYEEQLKELFKQQRKLELGADFSKGFNGALSQQYDDAIRLGASPSIKYELNEKLNKEQAAIEAELAKNKNAQQAISDKIREINNQYKSQSLNYGGYTPPNETVRPETSVLVKPDFSATFTAEDYKAVEEQTKDISSIYVDKLQQALDENIEGIKIGEKESLLNLEKIYAEGLRTKADYEKEKTAIVTKSRAEQLEIELRALQVMKSEYDENSNEYKELYVRQLSLQIEAERLKGKKSKKDDNDGEEVDEKKKSRFKSALDPFKNVSEEQKENLKEGIEGYQQLSQAAADAYNKILQAQIDALDKEISIREKRVEEAKKLAERGNTEALRLEEDRLRKAQEQRARFARQQQTVNAAITVSNAIAAVARAALEGGGFGSAATIAALIAALAAGYAAVSSMTSDTESFATGVVDYKGKGGPRDDKNWVRISSGESIITAVGTQKNRALLEAINQGAALHMIDPTLPMMMPMLKQPGSQQGNAYTEAKDLKRLETKLDEVVGAIENNKLKQNIFFNEQGVGIMTERAIQKDRKRWK